MSYGRATEPEEIDRFLADLAEDGPVLCLVDDAQWIGRESEDALLFAARRPEAEPVALILTGPRPSRCAAVPCRRPTTRPKATTPRRSGCISRAATRSNAPAPAVRRTAAP